MDNLSREQLEKLVDILVNMCLNFVGAQYTESILKSRGFGCRELEAIGFEVDGEWGDMDPCEEV